MNTEEIGTVVSDAIVVFGVVAMITFVMVATRHHWARSKASLVTGAGATLGFVGTTFAMFIIASLALCEVAANTFSVSKLTLAFEIGAAYGALCVGFHGAVHLDAVTKELLPTVGETTEPDIHHDEIMPAVIVQTPGLKKIAQKQGAVCWVCGEDKGAQAHLTGCPAAKGGAT